MEEFYFNKYKNFISDNEEKYTVYRELHKIAKEQVLLLYVEDNQGSVDLQVIKKVKELIGEEHKKNIIKNTDQQEIIIGKKFNEIYAKYIETLEEDWAKIEKEFFFVFPSEKYHRSYEMLHKNKNMRYCENTKKVMRLIKSKEEQQKNTIIGENENFKKNHSQKDNEINKTLAALNQELKIVKDDNFIKEKSLRENLLELDSLKFLIQQQREELDKLKKEEKKNNLRNSHMFHINSTPERIPKCTDDCIIY